MYIHTEIGYSTEDQQQLIEMGVDLSQDDEIEGYIEALVNLDNGMTITPGPDNQTQIIYNGAEVAQCTLIKTPFKDILHQLDKAGKILN